MNVCMKKKSDEGKIDDAEVALEDGAFANAHILFNYTHI